MGHARARNAGCVPGHTDGRSRENSTTAEVKQWRADDRSHDPLFLRSCGALARRLECLELTAAHVFGYGPALRALVPISLRSVCQQNVMEEWPDLKRQQHMLTKGDLAHAAKSGLDVVHGRRRHSVAGRCLGYERTSTTPRRRIWWRLILELLAPLQDGSLAHV